MAVSHGLPATDGDIDETRLELQHIGFAAYTLRRQECCSRPAEGIEDDVAALGYVLHCIGDQRHRLDGRMCPQIVETPSPERIDNRIMPDI